MNLCHHCGRELQLMDPVRREDSCPHCKSDVKVCLNCRFHDPGANNQCREPAAEWVSEKTKSNFCEFFELRHVSALTRPGAGGAQSEQARARSAFDSLFRKS
jgi:hypothetical protein